MQTLHNQLQQYPELDKLRTKIFSQSSKIFNSTLTVQITKQLRHIILDQMTNITNQVGDQILMRVYDQLKEKE
jgi:hypothetical protein